MSIATADVSGNLITVQVPPTYVEVLKRIPGARYVGPNWTTPLTWPACLQLRAEFGDGLEISAALSDWARSFLKSREVILGAKAGEFVAEGLDPRLRPAQALAATWMAWSGRCMELDEMRCGKTPTTIQALRAIGPDAFPALVIAPSTNRWVWEDEIVAWGKSDGSEGCPTIYPVVLHGTAAQRKKQIEAAKSLAEQGQPVIVITNWESIRTLSRLAGYGSVELSDKEKQEGPLNTVGFKTVIADEAHRALDPHSKQTRALWWLMHRAHRRYILTATAIANEGGDLYSLWHAIHPEEAPVRTTWLARYTNSGQGRFGWEIGGFRPEHFDEMMDSFDHRMIRRTLHEVRPGMPDHLPAEIRRITLEGKQEKAYRDLKKKMVAELPKEGGGTGVLVVTDPLTLVGRLSYAAAATPVLDEEGNIVALAEPSVKVDLLKEILSEYPGDPLVVFCVSRKLAELFEQVLDKAKVTYVSVHGGVDAQLRAANIARFQAGEAQVCVCTTAAGAEGITLNRAWRTYFAQRDWSMVKNVQAEARTRGLEGGPPVETIIGVVNGTIEERAIHVGDVKHGYLQELLRDELRS